MSQTVRINSLIVSLYKLQYKTQKEERRTATIMERERERERGRSSR
jgi:hypothetical protein